MTDPQTVLANLDEHARELDELSKRHWRLVEQLSPIRREIEEWEAVFNRRMWDDHTVRAMRLPSEKMREQLAITDASWPRETAEKLAQIQTEMEIVTERSRHLKTVIDAKRSILSALKAEMEASR